MYAIRSYYDTLVSGVHFFADVDPESLGHKALAVNLSDLAAMGAAHEIGVKQVAYYLWNKFGASHRVKFVAVPFEPVVAEILEKVENGLMGVILKRMMMRAAARVAERMGVEALVTGESLGQVSSQTLTNLSVIDRVTA